MECEHCEVTTGTKSEMNIHMILKHRDQIEDSSEYKAGMSDGFLSTESKAPKGEQFGYRK